VKVWV